MFLQYFFKNIPLGSSTNHVQVIGFSNENALVSFQNVTYFPAPKKHVITKQ